MSYCRWSDGDLYIYEDVAGGWTMHVAGGKSFNFDTPGECADHAEQLATEGVDVQRYAIETLREEQAEIQRLRKEGE